MANYVEMWKDLGMDLENHDLLCQVLPTAVGDVFLSQENRPNAMDFWDLVISEVHGIRPAELIEAQKAGRKVFGTFCVYVPDEVVVAANGIVTGLCGGSQFWVPDGETVLPKADVLALTLPGTAETNNLISAERISMLKNSAFIVNVGRGNSIDQDAVIAALNAGRLAGAALDVFREEPIPEQDPAWNTPGLLVTPHCSGKMTMAFTRDTLVDTFCENLKHFHDGTPMLHVVDKSLGY
jgi:hypothetical protein